MAVAHQQKNHQSALSQFELAGAANEKQVHVGTAINRPTPQELPSVAAHPIHVALVAKVTTENAEHNFG